jgi:hypothetical protein
LFVVILPPGFDLSPGITETSEPVGIQTFVAQPTAEAFNAGILCGLAWLNEIQSHTTLFAPGRQCPAAKFRSVAHNDRFRQSALARHPIQALLQDRDNLRFTVSRALHDRSPLLGLGELTF